MPPRPDSDAGRIRAAAEAIAADPPALPDGWPRAGRCWPDHAVARELRRAGWPAVTLTLPVPQQTSDGRPAGAVEQTTACYPLPWVVEMCRRAGMRLADVLRGRIEDE